MSEAARIISVEDLLLNNKLSIPPYQRPYKWDKKNVADLLEDIENAIERSEASKYRIGTIILHQDDGGQKLEIVDGQQRIITLTLLNLYLDNNFISNLEFNENDKISPKNIKENYRFIKDWFYLKTDDYKDKVKKSYKDILEVVVISVTDEAEAFQLFDSQNSRGKVLNPHDLLKAYHLREIKDSPYEMRQAVTQWENFSAKEIAELFELYLFPILNWSRVEKSFTFSIKDIDVFKGIAESSHYTYAKRANKAMPYFQISKPFIAGQDFFKMVQHYLRMLNDIKTELKENDVFKRIYKTLTNSEYKKSAGFRYAVNLFLCVVLFYYDKFKNFNEQAIKKLFSWALMLRIDMQNLGFASINNYAIGTDNALYSNKIALFSLIESARLHTQIANMKIVISKESNTADRKQWNNLYECIKEINGYKGEGKNV